MPTVLQIDFPMQGPWGDEYADAFRGLAEVIERAPGLRWKIWTENEAEREGFGVSAIRARLFDVNEQLTAVTGDPLAR